MTQHEKWLKDRLDDGRMRSVIAFEARRAAIIWNWLKPDDHHTAGTKLPFLFERRFMPERKAEIVSYTSYIDPRIFIKT